MRVLVLVHEDLVPPDTLEGYSDKEIQEWKTEYDVITTLREMGHDVRTLGVRDDLERQTFAAAALTPFSCAADSVTVHEQSRGEALKIGSKMNRRRRLTYPALVAGDRDDHVVSVSAN